jgi:hypothetical protein
MAAQWKLCRKRPAAPALPLTAGADAMHGTLMRHADALDGCAEGSEEGTEIKAIVDLIEAYGGQALAPL